MEAPKEGENKNKNLLKGVLCFDEDLRVPFVAWKDLANKIASKLKVNNVYHFENLFAKKRNLNYSQYCSFSFELVFKECTLITDLGPLVRNSKEIEYIESSLDSAINTNGFYGMFIFKFLYILFCSNY